MTLESSKTLAAIGSVLMVVPGASIVGLILMYLGLKELGEYYKDSRISGGDVIIGLVFIAIGAIICISGIFMLFVIFANIFLGMIGLGLGLVGWIIMILGAGRVKKTLLSLAERTGENLFSTSATTIRLGSLIPIIGLILVSVTFIIMAIAFFTMKITPNAPIYNNTTAYNNTTSPPPTQAQSTQAQSTQAQSEPIANFCPNCGASVTSDATFCSNCGKQI